MYREADTATHWVDRRYASVRDRTDCKEASQLTRHAVHESDDGLLHVSDEAVVLVLGDKEIDGFLARLVLLCELGQGCTASLAQLVA